jgi:hypothetical protein
MARGVSALRTIAYEAADGLRHFDAGRFDAGGGKQPCHGSASLTTSRNNGASDGAEDFGARGLWPANATRVEIGDCPY